jgi:hypothetical protein
MDETGSRETARITALIREDQLVFAQKLGLKPRRCSFCRQDFEPKTVLDRHCALCAEHAEAFDAFKGR